MQELKKALGLEQLVELGAWEEIPAQLADMHPQDIAEVLVRFDPDERVRVFRLLPRARWEGVFSQLPPSQQEQLLGQLSPEEAGFMLTSLLPDDRTALLEELAPEAAERLLRLLTPADVDQALQLLAYPPESVGRLMTPRFVAVRPEWTVRRAMEHIRAEHQRGETVNVIFVTDARGVLLDALKLKQFIFSDPSAPVRSIMGGRPVTVMPHADREEAVRLIGHYDLEALPVVDAKGVLLGIVTVDDIMDVAEQEATEDFHKIGSVGTFDFSLREAKASLLYRKRVGWLVLLVFVNVLAGAGIAFYEATIEQVIALVFFLPLIIASGGNAGAQAATLMVRALATGDVHLRDWLRLWGKELAVALALGLTMAAVVFWVGLWRGGTEVGVVVALSMSAVVTVGSMLGMLLPFLLSRFQLDPATASAPLITSVADIVGVLVYFSIATAVLL